MLINEINKSTFSIQEKRKILFEIPPFNFYYKLSFSNTHEYFFSSGFSQNEFTILKLNSDTLFCADNKIYIFNNQGKILLCVTVFEPIRQYKLVENNIYLFSERISYEFSLENYSINELKWYSDVIIKIEVINNEIHVTCFDNSIYVLK